ncbi:MAG: CvpA family protein [Crocinitomicaceae bacterium]|nr:CvpA family protein [Crocinitomicaceae bacterium]
MNVLDILILIPVAFGIWRGFKKGFIIELFTFLALFIGLYGGIHLSDGVSSFLRDTFSITSEYLPTIAFTITFLLIGAMVYFAGVAIEKAVKAVSLSLPNRLLGAVLGAFKMILFVGTAIILLQSYDEKSDIISEETKEGSLLFLPVESTTAFVIPALKESTIFLKNALNDKELLDRFKKSNAEEADTADQEQNSEEADAKHQD